MNTAPRPDLYGPIHKGLRACMSHTLVRLGRLDVHDAAELAEVSAELLTLLNVLRHHVHHENDVMHPAIESRAPGTSASNADDHVHHLADIAALQALLECLPADPGAAGVLYATFARFTAENFEHMQHEETTLTQALWATHTDAELFALHDRIVASLTPEEHQWSTRWMLPHLSPAERAGMLQGMRQAAPPAVFDELLSRLRPLLGGRDWRKLSDALGLA